MRWLGLCVQARGPVKWIAGRRSCRCERPFGPNPGICENDTPAGQGSSGRFWGRSIFEDSAYAVYLHRCGISGILHERSGTEEGERPIEYAKFLLGKMESPEGLGCVVCAPTIDRQTTWAGRWPPERRARQR